MASYQTLLILVGCALALALANPHGGSFGGHGHSGFGGRPGGHGHGGFGGRPGGHGHGGHGGSSGGSNCNNGTAPTTTTPAPVQPGPGPTNPNTPCIVGFATSVACNCGTSTPVVSCAVGQTCDAATVPPTCT